MPSLPAKAAIDYRVFDKIFDYVFLDQRRPPPPPGETRIGCLWTTACTTRSPTTSSSTWPPRAPGGRNNRKLKAAGVMCPGAHLPGGRVKQGKTHRGSPWTPKGPLHAKAEVVLDVKREEYHDSTTTTT